MGINQCLYSDKTSGNKAVLLAIVSGVIENQAAIQYLMQSLDEEVKDPYLLMVYIYELIIGPHKAIQGGGGVKRLVLSHRAQLEKLFNAYTLKNGPLEQRLVMMRYARVNTVKMQVGECIQSLVHQGYTVVDCVKQYSKGDRVVSRDSHIPELLVFPAGHDLHDHPLVLDFTLILQDKASCMPAFVLSCTESPPTRVLDACSAPGNKTTHIAALLPKAKILAVERDPKRVLVLERRVQSSGADNIEIVNQDFMSVMDEQVEAILLDPSCSGSGMQRLEHRALQDTSRKELRALARNQLGMLLHAMEFPKVTRISYSTCSIHRQENEEVVVQALQHPGTAYHWHLEKALPQWTRRGVHTPLDSKGTAKDMFLRTEAKEDLTNGFFVAVLVRGDKRQRKRALEY